MGCHSVFTSDADGSIINGGPLVLCELTAPIALIKVQVSVLDDWLNIAEHIGYLTALVDIASVVIG